jgi:hypothetical protein
MNTAAGFSAAIFATSASRSAEEQDEKKNDAQRVVHCAMLRPTEARKP